MRSLFLLLLLADGAFTAEKIGVVYGGVSLGLTRAQVLAQLGKEQGKVETKPDKPDRLYFHPRGGTPAVAVFLFDRADNVMAIQLQHKPKNAFDEYERQFRDAVARYGSPSVVNAYEKRALPLSPDTVNLRGAPPAAHFEDLNGAQLVLEVFGPGEVLLTYVHLSAMAAFQAKVAGEKAP